MIHRQHLSVSNILARSPSLIDTTCVIQCNALQTSGSRKIWRNILTICDLCKILHIILSYQYINPMGVIIFTLYYRLSIYSGHIWHDSAQHSTTITITKLRSDLHSRTTPHTSPLRASYGLSSVSYTNKNARDLSRAHCSIKKITSNRIPELTIIRYWHCCLATHYCGNPRIYCGYPRLYVTILSIPICLCLATMQRLP